MEAVTLRGPLLVVTLALIPLVPPTASATTPLPAFAVGVEDVDVYDERIRGELFEKHEPMPERCTPRREFCFGPIDPDVDFEWGDTGYKLWLNDTSLRASHHPGRAHEYGPYEFDDALVVDDLRVCWEAPCRIANPFTVYAHVDPRVEIWAFGVERFTFDPNVTQEIDAPRVLPETFGCEPSDDPC